MLDAMTDQSDHSLIDFTPPEPPQVWLVAYINAPQAAADAPWKNRLLSRLLGLLRPGFQHVLAVSPLRNGDWLVCNPGSLHLGLTVAPRCHVLEPLREGVAAGGIRCQAVIAERPSAWQLRGLFTCANVIAHLVGVPARPFLTPYALYRRIEAMHGARRTDAEASL